MIRFTPEARAQVVALTRFYEDRQRMEAASNLAEDIIQACSKIIANPSSGLSAPRPYPELAELGFRWARQRIYWIAWMESEQGPIITNIIHERADFLSRVSPARDPASN